MEDSKDYVNQVIKDTSADPQSRFVFAIVEEATNRMIGSGELNVNDFTNKEGEIGYITHPDYWGRGIGTGIANFLIDFGFKEVELHRIFSTCDPRNIGSSKILEKVGMTREGKLRENMLLKDGWRDSLLYSILEQEWK